MPSSTESFKIEEYISSIHGEQPIKIHLVTDINGKVGVWHIYTYFISVIAY